MACERKKQQGHCNHFQCQYPEASGYECVDIMGDYCEVGEGCINDCKFSFIEGDTEARENQMQSLRLEFPLEDF